jgi:sarcosine oxidase, subunit alpha
VVDRFTRDAYSGPVLNFEGRDVGVEAGDTVASALYRSGVRTFTRSFKHHRRRGLYCLTGDCPNCMVEVDGQSWVRACITTAVPGQQVRRQGGWPSTDHDLFGIFDRLHFLMPVGFYYKALLRPKWLWPRLEPFIRRVASKAFIDEAASPDRREVRHLHSDVVVIGGGVAGLSASLAAAERGQSVLLCDEGHLGDSVSGPALERVHALATQVAAADSITLLESAPAIGIYEGPLVVINAEAHLLLAHPKSVVVATGAVERHGVFPGNDLPGVMLGRGACRLAAIHGVRPGERIVLVGSTGEVASHAAVLRASGAAVTIVDGDVKEARGRTRLRSVVIECDGVTSEIRCDALVLSLGLNARDSLARQAPDGCVIVIGDAATPGLSIADTEREGSMAGERGRASAQVAEVSPRLPDSGVVCLCEDVGVGDLKRAWDEGFRSTEILKRYTTATMGACQGQLCQNHLRSFVAAHAGSTSSAAASTTARPPARPLTLEQAAAGIGHELHQETSLHGRHVRMGATMESVGAWLRPRHYGSALAEYWAVRREASIMDVGTLGKFLIAGADATAFLERLYPSHIADLQPGRVRYALMLGEHGFVIDDGIVCASEGKWYVTVTSAGAGSAEAHIKDWADTLGLRVHVVDLTAAYGAINVAGPRARQLLQRLSSDAFDNASFPYLSHRDVVVGGVSCRAIRLGFVGELSYELHHPSNQSEALWDALLSEGTDLGVRPHGLDALRLLRLEKGHIIIGQDTDFDATPRKLNMEWAVKLEKPWFVGKHGVERANKFAPKRRLAAIEFEREAPPEGSPLRVQGQNVGYLSSSGWSPVLRAGVALGWVDQMAGEFPTQVESGRAVGSVVCQPFYDPLGERLRA